MPKKLTQEEFIKRCKDIHGDKYDYSKTKYENKRTKVIIICPIHGEFEQRAESHYLGQGCPKCGRERANLSESLSKEEILLDCNKTHNNLYEYDLSEFDCARNSKLKINCKRHGWFYQSYFQHVKGSGCPICARLENATKCALTTENFVEKAKIIHNNQYDYSEVNYINEHTPVVIICSKHGKFLQKPDHHLQGSGCPKCVLKAQSKLQKAILTKLPELELEWEASPEWLGKMRFDLYSSKYNFEIEHHGIQHYQPIELFGGEKAFQERLKADALKTKLCNDNNCKQFIMKYDYTEEDLDELINNIKQIIDNYDS